MFTPLLYSICVTWPWPDCAVRQSECDRDHFRLRFASVHRSKASVFMTPDLACFFSRVGDHPCQFLPTGGKVACYTTHSRCSPIISSIVIIQPLIPPAQGSLVFFENDAVISPLQRPRYSVTKGTFVDLEYHLYNVEPHGGYYMSVFLSSSSHQSSPTLNRLLYTVDKLRRPIPLHSHPRIRVRRLRLIIPLLERLLPLPRIPL